VVEYGVLWLKQYKYLSTNGTYSATLFIPAMLQICQGTGKGSCHCRSERDLFVQKLLGILIMQVREQAVNSWHFVGSCGIGRVLDSDLRVIGFDNLKVVDASAIPDMPENSGPVGTTYMLAEYAAERIIAEAGPVFGDDDDETKEGADKSTYHA
jgi:choline dehydrogenase-like flavoprotein